MIIRAKKLALEKEPEDDERILKINMEVALAGGLACFGVGAAIALSTLSNFEPIVKIILFPLSIIFVFAGASILIGEFIPRRDKLLIIYKINKKVSSP
jgi:hypothetical protein